MKEIYKINILEEIILVLVLRIENKQFSTKFNRSKHERIKKHFLGDARPVPETPFNDAAKVYMWNVSCISLGLCSTVRFTKFRRELCETR